MTKTINQIWKEQSKLMNRRNPVNKNVAKNSSQTSLFACLFNSVKEESGGCLIYSDLQATSNSRISSSRESKIYQVGNDKVILAGTGSVSGIVKAVRDASKLIMNWRSKNELRNISPFEVTDILEKIMVPEEEAYFLMGAYNAQNGTGFIADIECDGTPWEQALCQVNGSGSNYMNSRAEELNIKVLGEKGTTTADIYEMLPQIDFPREVAMLEGLNVIHNGPTTDIYSGGKGYHLMVVDKSGVSEYVIPNNLADRILAEKASAEFTAVHPGKRMAKFKAYDLFEEGRRS